MSKGDVNTIVAALESIQLEGSEAENVYRLYALLEDFSAIQGRERAMSALFGLLERHPDAEIGNPGPITHELEEIAGYRPCLKASLARVPTCKTVEMVNRILNSKLSAQERNEWMLELQHALKHPLSTEAARRTASFFIEHQNRKFLTP